MTTEKDLQGIKAALRYIIEKDLKVDTQKELDRLSNCRWRIGILVKQV